MLLLFLFKENITALLSIGALFAIHLACSYWQRMTGVYIQLELSPLIGLLAVRWFGFSSGMLAGMIALGLYMVMTNEFYVQSIIKPLGLLAIFYMVSMLYSSLVIYICFIAYNIFLGVLIPLMGGNLIRNIYSRITNITFNSIVFSMVEVFI